MRRKIPPEAFDFYYSLGPSRSYRAVAEHYGVSKTAVANAAEREGWPAQLERREARARTAAEDRAVESREEMLERHLKMLRLIQGKAIEALRSTSLDSAMEAVRALGLAIREERVIRGEPGDRTALSVEDTIRREYERWLVTSPIEDVPSEPPPD